MATETGVLLDYLLHLGDNALVLAQRNCQWCGVGPVLEEDLALANQSLDLIGQARLLYQEAARVQGGGATEDTLAYFRDDTAFRNYVLLELPASLPRVGYAQGDMDWGVTLARNFLYSALMVPLWEALQNSGHAPLAAIAAKSLKEARYHLRHASEWVVRLGDGTDESHARMQAAFDHLMPYTQEFWVPSDFERAAVEAGIGVDVTALQAGWRATVAATLQEATLRVPSDQGYVPQGKNGVHSEHLSYLLAEMQSVARAHPGAQW
ncbi:MAG: 1,2-phenylacetyl-CoA epoxidase subunit PaaC [Pseudomonadota bacterium]|nr:1,2-phenylacetyl-CoA epoxidase subunit PaaC [Tepidimonas thermarum]